MIEDIKARDVLPNQCLCDECKGTKEHEQMTQSSKEEIERVRKAWLVRDRAGKMRRAIFFCSKEYIPMDDRHEAVRCLVKLRILKSKRNIKDTQHGEEG